MTAWQPVGYRWLWGLHVVFALQASSCGLIVEHGAWTGVMQPQVGVLWSGFDMQRHSEVPSRVTGDWTARLWHAVSSLTS